MHNSSLENMQRCIDWYCPGGPIDVADLGSSDVNGSYRDFFGEHGSYTGIDLAPGPGVDIVLEDPNTLPFDDEKFDLILSGQMLEHSAQFWRVFTEMARVMKPEGMAFVIAPSAGPIHRYPVDCYRFYPDGFQALAEWSGLRLVHCWLDERGPWRDLVGVFQKGGAVSPRTAPLPQPAFLPWISDTPSAIAEKTQGSRPYLDVLADIHDLMQPDFYLEIGVRKGNSLAIASCQSIAIDPAPDLKNVADAVELYECTSDDFFFFHAESAISEKVDLAFIDGMHHVEFVLRDFMNLERYMGRGGVIVIDDVLPNHPSQASRKRETNVWCGDVWRIIETLTKWRPDLQLTLLDTSPTGMLIVRNLDPKNRTLWDKYNPVVRQLLSDAPDPPKSLLSRSEIASPDREHICRALGI